MIFVIFKVFKKFYYLIKAPAISLAYESPESDIMKLPPRDPIKDKLVNSRFVIK